MSEEKQLEVQVPVPWAPQPITLTFFRLSALAVVVAAALAGALVYAWLT